MCGKTAGIQGLWTEIGERNEQDRLDVFGSVWVRELAHVSAVRTVALGSGRPSTRGDAPTSLWGGDMDR